MAYIVEYESADPKRTMLGGVVGKARSSRYESRMDAEHRKDGIVQVHAELNTPLTVYAVVREVSGSPEIYSDGSVVGCKWGKAGRAALQRV